MSIHPEQHPLDGKLEPETKDCFNDRAPLYSIAISLKRIADAPSEAAARITELEGDLKTAFREISKLAREAGEAKGRLAMSEAAGIVDGWRERAERAEARCRALENASPAEPSGWRPIERLKSWQGGMETEGPNAGEFTASMVFANHADCVSFIQFCASFPLPPTSEGGGA